MNTIFWICVEIMRHMSAAMGITYQELNVLLFVVLHPAITLIMIIIISKYRTKIKIYKQIIKDYELYKKSFRGDSE